MRDKGGIVWMRKEAIRTRRQPVVWKGARGVVIRKLGKEDYKKLQAFLTISLHTCIGKVDEKVVAELLLEEAGRIRVLRDGQFRGRI
jgi:hypothetical protein